jgi:hypothetical protein
LNPVPSHFLSFQPAAFSSCPPSRQRLSVFSVSAFQLFSSEPLNLLFRQRLSAFSFQLFSFSLLNP